MAFLVSGDFLVLEKNKGTVLRLVNGTVTQKPVIDVDPEGNRLYTYDLEGNSLVTPKLLLDLPAMPGADHPGGVIKIGPDNSIYLTSGDGDSCANRPRCQQGDFEDSVAKSQSSNVREGNPPLR